LYSWGGVVLKILHIGKYYEPHLGGTEHFTHSLYHELKKDVKIVVLCYNTKPKTEIINDNGIKVVKVATYGKIRSQPVAFGLTRWIKELSKDVDIINLHFPNPLAEIALLRTNINKKIIVTYHMDIVRQKILGKLYNPIMDKILKKSDVIIATSPNYAKTSKNLIKFKDKVKIIPLGINVNTITHRVKKTGVERIMKRYKKNISLCIGRLIYYKGTKYLVDAFKSIDGTLLVIGTGPLEKELKKNAPSNVHFLGKIADLNPYYAACDVFVFPSSERTEAFGMVQLEAMSFSKPLISTNLGTGTSFVNLNGKTGIVVKPKNSMALKKAVETLFYDKRLREKYGREANKRLMKYFTMDKVAKEYLKVYND
jgi:rhamnosyl/mannosyltransferase